MTTSESPPVVKHSRPLRSSTVALTLLLVMTAALWLPRLRGPIDIRWDAGVYYILGTSIAEGHGYRLLNEPGHPAGIQYPPGLPLVVAVTQWMIGTSDVEAAGQALRFVFLAISLAYTAVVFLTARIWLQVWPAFAASLLIATGVQTYFMASLLFADVPFALTTLGCLLALHHRRPWIAGALAVVSYLLRTAGIVALGTWVLEALIGRRYRQAGIRMVVALVPIVFWQGHVASVQNGPSYREPSYAYQRAAYQFYNVSYGENMQLLDPFQPELGRLTLPALVQRVAGNLAFSPYYFGQSTTAGRGSWDPPWNKFTTIVFGRPAPGWIVTALLFLIGCAPIAGMWALWRRGGQTWLVFLAGTWLIVAMTPWPGQFSRYLLPVAPIFSIALVLTTVTFVREVAWQRAVWLGAAGAIAGGVIINAGAIVLAFKPLVEKQLSTMRPASPAWFFHEEDWEDLQRAARWLGENADPAATVAAESAHYLYLLTGLTAIMPPMEADPAEAQRLLDEASVRYVVIGGQESPGVARRYMRPVVEMFPERWQLIHTVGGTTEVFERVSGGMAAPELR